MRDAIIAFVGVIIGSLSAPMYTAWVEKHRIKRELKYDLIKLVSKYFNTSISAVSSVVLINSTFQYLNPELSKKDPSLDEYHKRISEIEMNKAHDYERTLVDLEAEIEATLMKALAYYRNNYFHQFTIPKLTNKIQDEINKTKLDLLKIGDRITPEEYRKHKASLSHISDEFIELFEQRLKQILKQIGKTL